MLNKTTSVDREMLRSLNERRSELLVLSGDACDQALQACAQATQVQKDLRRIFRNLPLIAAPTMRQRASGNDDLWRLQTRTGHPNPPSTIKGA